jgi:sulfate transporter 4
LKERSAKDWAFWAVPGLKWISTYKYRDYLKNDTIAGLSVAAMVIPQAMAYAKLAGLPPEYGLYSAFVPVILYALYGTSKQMAVGPVAVVSLLLSDNLNGLIDGAESLPDNLDNYTNAQQEILDTYVQLAVQMALLCGIFSMMLGTLRLGFFVNFLSHAVIQGFMHGVGCIIILSQLKYIFGVKPAKESTAHMMVKALVDVMDDFNWRAFLMGMSWIICLVALTKLGKKYAKLQILGFTGPLIVCVLSIAVTWGGSLTDKVDVVGKFPDGLPGETFSLLKQHSEYGYTKLITGAIAITIVGFMESISVGLKLARDHGYKIDSNAELVGLGFANVLGSGFSIYPAFGCLSRSTVNDMCGAKTQMSAIIQGVFIGVILLVVTEPFQRMPLSAMGAIVIAGTIKLLDPTPAIHLWHTSKRDFFVWLVTLPATLFLGAELGLMLGVGVSFIIVLAFSVCPKVSELGRLNEKGIDGITYRYADVKRWTEAKTFKGLLILRVDAPLYFANINGLIDSLTNRVFPDDDDDDDDDVSAAAYSTVILDLSESRFIDSSAAHELETITNQLNKHKVQLIFAGCNLDVQGVFQSSDVLAQVPTFMTLNEAVQCVTGEYTQSTVAQHAVKIANGVKNVQHKTNTPYDDVIRAANEGEDSNSRVMFHIELGE